MTQQTVHFDTDPVETKEWLDALRSVLKEEGNERAAFLIKQLIDKVRLQGVDLPGALTTPYINTIPVNREPSFPGNKIIEKHIAALIRWNAVMMVLRAGKVSSELGGHIATYASAATLYEVGFNHFFHAVSDEHGGDLLYIQGHSSPGIYARAFLEGRLSETQLAYFRQEIGGKGISSYPHPWLMPDFWQFPTVSMGLGPMQAIYQARFLKYLQNRELLNLEKTQNRKIWMFCGDGEMDEPESLGALSIAAREKLDNLIFVINCNLQRLDGPVRGNGKIIQELEGVFRGAGWNVIKVIWGCAWDTILEKDKQGLLQRVMMETVDGEYQNYRAKDGGYIREHFFGKFPELKSLVEDMSNEDIWRLKRGGHDIKKVYAAYRSAVEHKGQPTVILAKTIKGYGMGTAGEGQNITHQQKKMTQEQLLAFRDRFKLKMTDEDVEKLSFYHPGQDSIEIKYLQENRKKLGGYLPGRRLACDETLKTPALDTFASLRGSNEREVSTTMVFVEILRHLLKDKVIGPRIVPIVPDESRTFGMEGLFRQIGIYSPIGQLYKPVDADQLMYYREDKKGQLLEEGINEGGAFCSWMAAATSYSTNNLTMIPFYIYYSMFGYQRVGDFVWAAGDMQARGFILGATAGRTTLAGEGLQHQDGHNLLFFSVVPNCVAYDPCFAYELAVIIQDGLRRMVENQENVFYYLTLMNENYKQPALPTGSEEGILKGMYLLSENKKPKKGHVQLLGSGTILNEVIAAAELLETDFNITSDIWSVTSFSELRKEALSVERHNNLHPRDTPKLSYVTDCLHDRTGPVIAATDYIRLNADQIRGYLKQRYVVLGTDGFGRSDTREQLRLFFEVNRFYIVLASLHALVEEGMLSSNKIQEALKKYNIDTEKPDPVKV
ncbi:MAG: pyruvate dehydrogenase (acetyl-transferring), homodimeric type [Rickettsiella sp.]|nr:pyruvate dehydrogenase (acetyl-transferring), homodimeric type [Rickettsiella sp.]